MISVCMATYNGEKYLKMQLDSILKQLSSEDEVIISDDGSTDKTIDLIYEYKKIYNNIKLINGPQKGVVKNFENALKCAQGDIIFLTDQDDIWVDGKVERVIQEMNSREVDLIIHDACVIDNNEKIIYESFFQYRKSKPGLIKNIIKNSYLGCCVAFKKRVLEKCLPIPDNISMHDWWIGIVSERFFSVYFLNEIYLKYRRHGGNVSSFNHYSILKMIKIRLYLIKELIKR